MADRARYADAVLDLFGRPVSGATVEVFQEGTTTPITETIFVAATGVATRTNPFLTGADGEIEFFLTNPKRVSLRVSAAGLTTETHVVDVLPDAEDISLTGGGGAPADASYLVGAAHAGLSAEIVVGATPGGELGGSWATPTVDPTHSGSPHHAEDHAARHAAGAADPLMDAVAPSTQAFGDAAAVGAATVASKRDHKHGMPVDPVPTHAALADAHHAQNHAARHASGAADPLMDETAPSTQAFGDAAAPGAVSVASKRDHKHAMPTNPIPAHEAAADPHAGYQKESEKGQLSGYASLDAAGDVPDAQIPDSIARDSELHAQVHGLTSGDHSHSGGAAGRFMRETGAAAFAFQAVELSRGGTMLDPVAKNIIVWRAPFACTVTNVRGYRVGGTGATVNARKNGASNHLASDLSLTSPDTWMDGGAVQNTAYAAGDKMEIMIVSVTGTPTQVAIQVDLTRP